MGVHKVNSDKGGGVRPDITWSNVGEPDNYMPSQYFDTRRRTSELDPEKRMVLAMLEDAVDLYQRSANHNRDDCVFCKAYADGIRKRLCVRGALYQEAYDWIFGEVVEPLPPFSFPWVCQMFNIDVEQMRKGLVASATGPRKRRSPVSYKRNMSITA